MLIMNPQDTTPKGSDVSLPQNLDTQSFNPNEETKQNVDQFSTFSQSISSQSLPSTATDDDMDAKDVDLIEKEWVKKAEEIITNTENDPYNQTKEFNKLKADYLKKRYNKEIKYDN